MEDIVFVAINIIALISVFIVTIMLIFKSTQSHIRLKHVEYLVYKPLFPFELPKQDPFRIASNYKRDLLTG
jgi:hypothetical protein